MSFFALFSPEKLARFSGRHPWYVVGVWVGILLLAGALAATLLSGVLTTEQDFTNNPESKRANQVVEDKVRGPMRSVRLAVATLSDLASPRARVTRSW